MPAFDYPLIVKQFPEIADIRKYPIGVVQAQWNVAALFIDTNPTPCRALNGDALAYALNCLAIHLLTLSEQNQQTQQPGGGGLGSNQGGLIASASVGSVSVSRAAFPAEDKWTWWLSQTPYGQALLALLDMIAVGGFSVGGLPEREGFRKVGGVFF